MRPVRSVLIIGDSFVQGVGAPDNFGWAQRVAAAFPEIAFDIQGVASDTAEKIYARWPERDYDLVVMQVGTNDSCHRQYKDGPEMDPERFAKYLEKIHERLRRSQTPLMMVGLLFVDETGITGRKADKTYSNAQLDLYDGVVRRFAKRHGLGMVPLHSAPRHGRMLADGLHPSERGHDFIANRAIKLLRPILTPEAEATAATTVTA